MNKSEFVTRVAKKAGVSRIAAARAVDAIFDSASGAISEMVHAAGSLSIPGFGKFTKQQRGPTRKRHPASGAVIDVPERATVVFSPGDRLRADAVGKAKRRRETRNVDAVAHPAHRGADVHEGTASPESELKEIRSLAEHVWENKADAEQFLTSPHAMLDGHTPEEAASTRAGAERVREILMRLEYSIPA
jgi:DNA-binding protein HU-beta